MENEYQTKNELKNIRLMRKTLYGIMFAIFIAIVWSIFAKIDEYAKTKGEVIPVSDIQQIQTLEGGRIEKIMVRDGDIVKAGQVIILFDPLHASSELKRQESKAVSLILKAERLRAFAQENKPDFSKFIKDYPELVDENKQALRGERKELEAEINQTNSELTSVKAELAKIERELPSLKRQLKATRDILTMYEDLMKKHASSKRELLMNQQKEADISKQYEELMGQKKVVEERINGFDEKVAKIKKLHFSEALDRHTQALAELAEVNQLIIDSKDKLKRRKMVSPIDGIIKSVSHTSVGTVLSPGGVVAEIVPIGTDIVIEVKIQPQDIGFIKIGLKSIIKFDAFDYSRYGSVYGKVVSISPTTFTDPKRGMVYYKARVKPNKNYVGHNPEKNLIIPGMTAEVDILTDKKTVFQAIIKPVYNAMDTAFRGR
jgi:HlyD family type I secretion membrane fusion protein